MELTTADLETFARSLEQGDTEQVVAKLVALQPSEAAEFVRALPQAVRHIALLALPTSVAADVLEDLPDDIAAAAVMEMQPGIATGMVREMRSDEQTDLLQDVSPSHAEAILAELEPAEAAAARSLIVYGDHTAGGLMQTEFVAIAEGMVVGDVVGQLRERAEEYADYPAFYVYIVDGDGRLLGVASLRSILLCNRSTPVATVAAAKVVSAPPDLPGVGLLKLFRRYHMLAVPVVDTNNVMLGVVTQNDALQFSEEDADEEMLRLAGIAGGDEFRDMPLRRRASHRLSWLSVNVLLNVAAASVIVFYEETLQEVIALAAFLPIISDMNGCSGNQAVAVSIRELSLERIRPTTFFGCCARNWRWGL
ncbi:MAG: magnesium transporter [Planctomycetota bacterium]|jgi:magnesium transporter